MLSDQDKCEQKIPYFLKPSNAFVVEKKCFEKKKTEAGPIKLGTEAAGKQAMRCQFLCVLCVFFP